MTTKLYIFLSLLLVLGPSSSGAQEQNEKETALRGTRNLRLDPKTIDAKANIQQVPHWSFDPAYCLATPWNDCTPQTHLKWPHDIHTCQELLDKGIKSMIFLGDSYMRHAYIATLLYLSGDYKRAALQDDDPINPVDPKCFYGGQFDEVECRTRLRTEQKVCNGKIKIVRGSHAGMWVPFQPSYLNTYDVIVWWGGNHPVDNNYNTRYGVHDAEVVAKEILQPQCGTLPSASKELVTQKVIWLDTHVRQCHGSYCHLGDRVHDDETLPVVQQYHDEMPYHLRDICGITKIASAWDASMDLVTMRYGEADTMTFDRVHWGMQLNLLKAHEILHQILL